MALRLSMRSANPGVGGPGREAASLLCCRAQAHAQARRLVVWLFLMAMSGPALGQDAVTREPSMSDAGRVLLFVLIGIVSVVVGGILVAVLRRRLLSGGGGGGADADAKLLETLRAMKARGELGSEEFAAGRGAILGRLERSMRGAGKDSGMQRLNQGRTQGKTPGNPGRPFQTPLAKPEQKAPQERDSGVGGVGRVIEDIRYTDSSQRQRGDSGTGNDR